jgi:hypothetical protein
MSDPNLSNAQAINSDQFTEEQLSNSRMYGSPRFAKQGELCPSLSAVNAINASDTVCKTVMCDVIGIAPHAPDYRQQIKKYLNNVREFVPGSLELDISFNYTDAKYVDLFKEKADAIERTYLDDKATKPLSKALLAKTTSLFRMEEERLSLDDRDKPVYGRVVNPRDYFIYLFCLCHSLVVKDADALNIAQKVRFMMIDQASIDKEVAFSKKLREEAIKRYVELISNPNRMLCVAAQLGVNLTADNLATLVHDKMSANPSAFVDTVSNPKLLNDTYLTLLVKYGVAKRNATTNGYYDGRNESFELGRDRESTLQFLASTTDKAKAYVIYANQQLKAKIPDVLYAYLLREDQAAKAVAATTPSQSAASSTSTITPLKP